jgi:hypothetical protein
VEEQRPESGARVIRVGQEAPVHVGVSPWLIDHQAADVIQMLLGIAALFKDRLPGDGTDTSGHDPEWLPGRVILGHAYA